MAAILGDEISRQMDADLFGTPRKSSLDPKLSGEMDRDLGIAPSRPWAGANKPPEPEEPGYLGALGKGIYTGFRRRLPEMTGQAIQFTGVAPETGKAIAGWAREGEERPQFKSAIKQALYEGGEMLAPSVAIPAALGAAGVGVLPASVATAALFGLSQAQSTKEEAEKRGVEPGNAPYATGAIEAVGETVGTAALGRLLGPLAPILARGGKVAVKDVIKPTVSRILKEFPRTLAIEGGTEFGQQFGQALVEKRAGIRPEAEPLSEGVSTLPPTAVLTGLTMGMAIPFQRLRARSVEKSLEDEKSLPEARRAAADHVAAYMAEADEEFAKRWRARADQAITKGEKIPIDQDIYEWLGEVPGRTAPQGHKESIPSQPKGYDLIARKPAEPEVRTASPEPQAVSQPPAGPAHLPAPAGAIPEPEKPVAERPVPNATKEGRDLLQEVPPHVEPGPAIPQTQEETKVPVADQEKKRAERKKTKGYFPAETLWDKTVEEVQDEWSAFMADYEDVKAKTEKELAPLRKELESLRGKRDKFSAARKKEIQNEIGQKEEIYKSIPAQAENDYLNEIQKFAGMVEEEARKRGIPEERIHDFVTDFQIYSSNERPYIESNYDLSHREIFDELAQEYLTPQEGEEPTQPKAAIPAVGLSKEEALPPIPEAKEVEIAAAEAATSPTNALPEPTESQKEAGNYKKGHLSLHGLDISIENPKGSERSGVSPEGKKWETTLAHHYGYIRDTKGRDKDHLDVFIGPYPDSEFVTVIDQVDPKTGKFDEHKIMMGFRDVASAQVGYLANYEPGWKGLGAAKGLDILEFKDWLKKGDTTKPIALETGGRPAYQGTIPAPERRKDLEKRKRISEMTLEEMKKELLTDPLTGLGNRRAYEESRRLPFQAMIDADSLKAVNDIMGHEAGDELLKAIGKALGKHATRAFHTSGDEFIVEGSAREELDEQLRKAKGYLAAAEIEATAPDGTTYIYKGLEISYGIGSTLKEADEAMAASKREREERGFRAPRGERPKGMAAIPAPGVEAAGKPSGREEPEKLPTDWLDTGWKIEQRGVLQIAISPGGKEYTLWGQRLEPIEEPQKAESKNKPTRTKYALEGGEPTEITQDLVQKAFPNARVAEEDYGYRVDLPNGQVIDVTREKEISLNRAAAERAYGRAIKPTEYPVAAFQKIGKDGIISLTEEGAGKIDEEVFHAAMAMALTPEERQSILSRYNNNEEQAARAYQEWLADENAKPDTLWQKIKDFFTAVREAFFPTERTPFKRIRSGEVWERKLKRLGPDAYDLGEVTDPDVLYALDKLKWAYPVKDSDFGTVNNRLSKELEVFEKLFGKSDLAIDIPGKYVDGRQEMVRSISAHDLGQELFRVKESGLLSRMADPKEDPNILADELGFAGSDRDAFIKELAELRRGSLYLELGEDGKPILSANGKTKMSADFLLATCQPTTPCKECYAAKAFIRISNVKKAFRNTVHILLDPEGWAERVAKEAARVNKTALPFIRLLGSGDLTPDEMVSGFNALAQKADRPIQIFSRHHDNLAKLKGTQKAPFIKMGSIDADLYKHYGFRFLKDNFKKRGIVNAWLYTDASELPMVQRLYDADALGLILSAKVELHEALPEPLQMSSCPCDADERTYVSSCKQCALSEAGCFMSFAPIGVDANGKLWEFMDPKAPSSIKPITAFTAGIEEGKAKGYQSVFADRIAKSIKLIYLYIREFKAGSRPAIPLKDIQFPNDVKYTKSIKAAETYIKNLETARDRSEEGTFYIAGGRIQKPLRFTNWRVVEEEPKYALRDITESTNFKNWFKDSKVVDEEGKPLQVYHGRVGDFTSFGRGPTELSALGWHYFSDNPAFAEKFSYTEKPLREPEKTTVKIATAEGMRDVPGYRTDIPGLAIADYNDLLTITHERSGFSLVRAEDLNTALDIVDAIKGTRINFDRDQESLSKLSPRTLKILRNAIERGRGAYLASMFGYKPGAKGVGVGSNIVPAYLAIRNPLDLRELPAKNVSPNRLKEALAKYGIELPDENYFWSGRDLYQVLNQPEFARALKDAMREKGMDGIVFPDYYDQKTRGTIYIAFEPQQIKSPYNEAFSPEDERINFALRETAPPLSTQESPLSEGFPMFMPERSSWSDRTSRVVPHSTIQKMKGLPDYQAARNGDDLAGLRVARAAMKPEKIAELQQSLKDQKKVIIVPVRMKESGGRNTIPNGMAAVISEQTGWEIDESIYQINDVSHTNKDAIERLLAQAEFSGDVNPDATYVILDDVVTTGGTLANLKGFIESRGGKVGGIQTIGAAQFATNLRVMPGTIKKLQTYGQNLKDALQYVYGGQTNEENLTESEARTLIYRQREVLDRARAEKAKGGFDQGLGLNARRTPQRIQPEEVALSRQPITITENQLEGVFKEIFRLLPWGSRVTLWEDIDLSPFNREQIAMAWQAWGEDLNRNLELVKQVAGYHKKIKINGNQFASIIEVATRGLNGVQIERNLWHEAFHAVQSFYLTDAEREILERKFPGHGKESSGERQAEAFARYVLKEKGLLPKSVSDIFARIAQFFEKLGNYLNNLGFKSAEDVFGAAYRGEMKAEAESEAAAEAALSFKDKEARQAGFRYIKATFKDESGKKVTAYLKNIKETDKLISGIEVDKFGDEIIPKGATERLRIIDKSLGKFEEYRMNNKYGELEPLKTSLPIEAGEDFDSPQFLVKAEQDPNYKKALNKNRLGLVKVTDNDLKLWERVLSLPFWLQQKYKELRPLVETQIRREENRSELIHDLLRRGQPFFDLKGEELARAEKALSEGDAAGQVWDDGVLREKYKLSPEGIKGYRAVRDTLDLVHAKWKEKIEENVLREYKKEKWYLPFLLAHGLDITNEQTLALGKSLRGAYRAMEKPVEVIRRHLQQIIDEAFTGKRLRLMAALVRDYDRASKSAKAHIDKIKEILNDTIAPEGISEEDLNKMTKGFILAYIQSRPAINQLKEMREELNKIKGYFPRTRKPGKYRVAVIETVPDPLGKDQTFTLYYQNAANRLEATKIYDKLMADPEYKDYKIIVEVNRNEPETSFMGASAINMQRLIDNAMEKLKTKGEIDPEDANMMHLGVLEALSDELKARGAGRFSIHRKDYVIEGYEKTGLKQVLKNYIDGWSGMITKQDAALEFLEELKEISRNKPQLMAYASKYAQDMLRNQESMDRVSAKMRSLAFVYFLGGSLRAALVNFTQNYVTGIPFLAREVGAKSLKAEKLYHKAMFDVAVGKNINTIEQKMLDEMINKGVAEDQFIRQVNREVKGAVGQATGKVVDILSKPFSWMEKLNRKSAALAMFREKYRSYLSHTYTDTLSEQAYSKAFEDAQDFVYKTHYLMTKANLPSVAAGGDIGAQFLKTAYTFRRFTHNYLLSLHHSLKGEESKLALDVMARSLAYVVLLAGLPAIPFFDDLLDEWEKFFGTPVRSNMRKTLRDAGGPVLEKMGMAGIPALMGIDISGSLKIGIPLAGAGTPQDTIYGVYGGLARKSFNVMSAAEREDYLRALEFASPAFIEATLKAYRMADTGVTTPRGKVITDEQGKPIRLGAGEGIAQAAGFRPERLARISGEHWTMENVQKHFKEKRDGLYSRYRLARAPEEKRRVMRDMQRFNMETRKYRGVIPPITPTSLGQATQQKPEKPFIGFGRMMETN